MKDITVLKNGKVVKIIVHDKIAMIWVLTPELTRLDANPLERWAYIDTMEEPTLRKIRQLHDVMQRTALDKSLESTFNPECVIRHTGDTPYDYYVKCSADCRQDDHHDAYVIAVTERRPVTMGDFSVTPTFLLPKSDDTLNAPLGFPLRTFQHVATGKFYHCIAVAYNTESDGWNVVYSEVPTPSSSSTLFTQPISRFCQKMPNGKPRFVEVKYIPVAQ
jgi:hypothetical protein